MAPETLAALWLQAKQDEQAANRRRLEIEAHIIASLGCPEDASRTHTLNGFKVTTTGKLTYKADLAQLALLAMALPESLRPIKTESRLDEVGAKWLRNNEPQYWSVLAPAIEVKPAKVAIKIEEI